MAVDWLRIRNDYINGGGSYRKLAEKYNIPFSVLKDVAVREKWADAKKKHTNRIRTETEQKTIEKTSDVLSDEALTKVRIRSKLWNLIERWLDGIEPDGIKDHGDFRKVAQCCIDLGIAESEEQSGTIEDLSAIVDLLSEKNG